MSTDGRHIQQAARVIARARAIAVLMAVLLLLLAAGMALGLAVWIATLALLVIGAVALVALIRVGDMLRGAVDAERAEILTTLAARAIGGAPLSAPTADALADRLEAERLSLESRVEAMRELVDLVEFATIGIDPSGRVWLANAAARELLGPQIEGRAIDQIFTLPELVAIAAGARRGSVRQARVRLPRSTGNLILDVSACPLRPLPARADDKPTRCSAVMTFRDVTDLATAMQLKTDFVANASHELRTPLAAIRASVETIEDAAGDDPEARARFLRTIASAATRLEELCRDLLDLSRVETTEVPVEYALIAFHNLGKELGEFFETACVERRLTIEFSADPGAALIRSDARVLNLILRNLVENAAKFAFEGTAIRVVARVQKPELAGQASARRDLVIEVIDRGIGIPIGLQPRIFERFFQADPARAGNGKRGTGLGLAIVKHAVRTLGGRISVESVWKQGTTMRVELPDAIPAPSDLADSGSLPTT